MLDNMKLMATLAGLMKNKDKVKAAGDRIKDKAQAVRATGEAGGGAARATVDGKMTVLSVELSPALIGGMAADDKTRDLAGSLIAEAVNNALRQAQQRMKAAIDEEAKALGFEGGLPDLPLGLGQ